jgi:hypothetical protein
MSRLKLWKGYYLGTGLLSVVGTSFATLSTATAVCLPPPFALDIADIEILQIFNVMYSNGTCPSTVGADGTITRGSCPDAYGMVLGKSVLSPSK